MNDPEALKYREKMICFTQILALLPFFLATAHAATGSQVQALLVLAADVSDSIKDPEVDGTYEYQLQKAGIVEALTNAEVIEAVETCNPIAITYVEWSGNNYERQVKQVIPWTKLNDRASLKALALQIESSSRQFVSGATDIEGALIASADLFRQSPYAADRHVISLSSDGQQNTSLNLQYLQDPELRAQMLRRTRDQILKSNPLLTINALIITNDNSAPDMERYFQRNVIGGPGAFVSPAAEFRSFSRALIEKLKREICILTS